MNNRIKQLKKMHNDILNYGGDESWYAAWIIVVPDEPTDDDFAAIAQDTDDYAWALEFYTKFLKAKD